MSVCKNCVYCDIDKDHAEFSKCTHENVSNTCLVTGKVTLPFCYIVRTGFFPKLKQENDNCSGFIRK